MMRRLTLFIVCLIIDVATAHAVPILFFSDTQTQVDFVTQFNQAPPSPIIFVFENLPTNPVGPGALTVTAIGDFAPGDTESFSISADNGLLDFGTLYNNNPADDLFDNASFGDSGIGSLSTGTIPATATINRRVLSLLVADAMIEFLITFGATVGDRPQESMTLTLQYKHVSVPEPTTLALFGVGLAGLAFSRRRRVPLLVRA